MLNARLPSGPVAAFIAPSNYFEDDTLADVDAGARQRGLVPCFQTKGRTNRVALFTPKHIPAGWRQAVAVTAPCQPDPEAA